MEKPTFPLWKQRHASLAALNPEEYRAKHDTRKSYQWIVLTWLQYDPGLLDKQQWTWPQSFVPTSGPQTAWGMVHAVWEQKGRKVFRVEACDRRRRDNYRVVFAADGTFITAISRTRDDARNQRFPLGRRAAWALLGLNEQVSDDDPRRVTKETVTAVLSPRSAKFEKRSESVWNIYIPRAVKAGIMAESQHGPYFTHPQAETRRQVLRLSPPRLD